MVGSASAAAVEHDAGGVSAAGAAAPCGSVLRWAAWNSWFSPRSHSVVDVPSSSAAAVVTVLET